MPQFLKNARLCFLGLLFVFPLAFFFCRPYLKRSTLVHTILLKLRGEDTVGDILDRYGARVDGRFGEVFASKKLGYPPASLLLLCFKKEMSVEIYASENAKDYFRVAQYPILAPSGTLGPKTLEGDMQIPEGIYGIEGLNPNSCYHLSMKIDYPNEFERERAREENRLYPGSDIFIHGAKASIGCISIGDGPIEDIFVLAARTGIGNTNVIVSPYDFRKDGKIDVDKVRSANPGIPLWTPELYRTIEEKIAEIEFDAE